MNTPFDSPHEFWKREWNRHLAIHLLDQIQADLQWRYEIEAENAEGLELKMMDQLTEALVKSTGSEHLQTRYRRFVTQLRELIECRNWRLSYFPVRKLLKLLEDEGKKSALFIS